MAQVKEKQKKDDRHADRQAFTQWVAARPHHQRHRPRHAARPAGALPQLRDDCPHCGTHLAAHRVDDAPAYFTILVVGHVIIPLLVLVERQYSPETWVHMVLWLPATLAMTMALLRPIKGALVALQWSIGLRHDAHGYQDGVDK